MALDTAQTGKISSEEWTARFGSSDGFDRYDTDSSGDIDQAEFLKAKQMEAIAGLVKDALGEDWTNVPIGEIVVKENSGFGGEVCYKVSAPGATPEAVALHTRSERSTAVSEGRTEAASLVFSDHGIGPKRLAQGDDWNIEPW